MREHVTQGITHAHQILFTGLWLGACGYALLRGGAPERITAVLFLAGAVLSRRLEHAPATLFQRIEVGIFTVDGAMFLVLLLVALTSARFWPMLMAVFQGAELLVHVGRSVAPGIVPDVYFATEVIWSFPMLVLLAMATRRHCRRVTRFGLDYSWTSQLPPAYRHGRPGGEARATPLPRGPASAV